MAIFIGIDFGTSSVKCAAFDETGNLRAQAERTYEWDSPREGWLEIHPERWWDLTCAALTEMVSQIDAAEVEGISLCGVMMMAVMLDAKGQVVRPTLSWLDQRVLPQLQWIKENHFDEPIFAATGTAISPSQTPLPLLWVKENEPDNFARIDKVILSKDYLRYKLTGNILTDLTDASGTLLLDNRTGEWNEQVTGLLGLPTRMLPDIASSAQVVGKLTNEVAQQVGLRAGVPVIAGCGDGVSTMLGLGIVRPTQLGITVGTAGVLMSTSPVFVVDEKRRCLLFEHPVPGQWYLVTATNTAGEAVRWFCNAVYKDWEESQRYGRYGTEAAAAPAGSRGLIFLPFLAGSRSPYYNTQARGCFFGLDLRHGLPEMARAVMEGVAYELKDCFDVHREVLANQRKGIEEVRISGGIIRNPLWMHIVADVLNCPLRVPQATDLGALGAAMNAAVGVKLYSDHEKAAEHMVSIVKEIEPDEKNQGIYSQAYALYRDCYRSSVPLYPHLANWVTEMTSN